MGTADEIGTRGEMIAQLRLSRPRPGGTAQYFRPLLLGEKYETFDILVRLADAGVGAPYFFVQVKSTAKPYTGEGRLPVRVGRDDVLEMVAFGAPTYVVGVHTGDERAYIASVHTGMSAGIGSLSTEHELTVPTLGHLWDEVRAYWRQRDTSRSASRFLN